ncbi:MAG: hypothetical protein WCZ66_05630 [Sphingomonadaceae bacterium]
MRLQLAGEGHFGLSDHRPRGGSRRGWGMTIAMVAGTLAIAVVSYSLSMKVSGERAELEQIARENHALAQDLKALDSELRVRMRLPQLQRWNDEVLGLMPISATQYLRNPLHLAAYGTDPVPVAPAPVTTSPSAPAIIRAIVPAEPQQPAAAPRTQLVSRTAPPAAQAAGRPVRTVAAEVSKPQKPQLVKVAAADVAQPRSLLDPELLAAIDAAAAREAAARPAGQAPANLLLQVNMDNSATASGGH